jgi:hypothetical protein
LAGTSIRKLERNLMGRVSWSDQAEADLKSIAPGAVRDQLRRNAEEILHLIPPRTAYPDDEGADGGIMWHRGDGHSPVFADQDDGPQNYFLFYRRRATAPGFEILAVRSIHQMARRWKQIAPVAVSTLT